MRTDLEDPYRFAWRYPYRRQIALSLVPCSWGFSEVLGRTDLQLQEMYQELLSLPSVVIVLLQIRSRGIFSLLSDGLTSVAVFPQIM